MICKLLGKEDTCGARYIRVIPACSDGADCPFFDRAVPNNLVRREDDTPSPELLSYTYRENVLRNHPRCPEIPNQLIWNALPILIRMSATDDATTAVVPPSFTVVFPP